MNHDLATSAVAKCRDLTLIDDLFPQTPNATPGRFIPSMFFAFGLLTGVYAQTAKAGEPVGKSRLAPQAAPLRLKTPADNVQRVSADVTEKPSFEPLPTPTSLPNSRISPGEPRWTLDALESLALKNNPTLLQAASAVDADRGIYDQVGRYPNPQIGYLRTDSSGAGDQSQGVFVSQEFVMAGKLRKNRAIEAWDIERLSWDAEAQKMRVLNDLKIRYFELLGAQKAVMLTQDLVRIATDGYETTERLSQAKQASRKDLLQAKVQMNTVRLNLREAEHRYDSAWSAIAVLIGVPDMKRAAVAGELTEAPAELDWNECLRELEARSPQMHAALARVQFARSELTRESVEAIPNLSVQVLAERDSTINSNKVSTLLSIPFPIFNRNKGNIHRAHAEIRQASAEVERVRLVLEDLLNESFRRYKTARDQVAGFREEIVPDAHETLQLTTEGYKQGEYGILEVLAARQTYFESSLAYIEALTELQKVTTEIQGLQLTGGLNPPEVGTALQGAGGVSRQRAVLNKQQENASKRLLPAAVQAGQ